MNASPASRHDSDLDDLEAILNALEDLRDDRISLEEYNVLNAAYEAKYPRPVYENERAPWDRTGSNLSPELRKLVVLKSTQCSNAEVSANQSKAESSSAQVPQGFAPNPLRSTLVRPVSRSIPFPSAPPKPALSVSTNTNCNTARLHAPANLKAWERLTEEEKMVVIGMFALLAGAIAFTVHMSARKQATLRRAAAADRDITQIVADDIARQFRRRGLAVPAILFGIEVAPVTDKIHIHGYYIPDGDTQAYFDQVRDAFSHALGKIKGQAGSTQFDCEALYTPDNWLRYFHKRAGSARRHLGVSDLLYVSRKIRQFGRDQHEARRKPAPVVPVAAPVPVVAPVAKKVRAVTQGRSLVRYVVACAVRQQPAQNARPGASLTISPAMNVPARSTSPPSQRNRKHLTPATIHPSP